MYYIYHIPGRKIGVTTNLEKRVTETQGYKNNEYEVLDMSEDIDYVSDQEILLQKFYGYKIDTSKYKTLYSKKSNKMKINTTDQTSTFAVPLNKLKGHLMDNIGLKWSTPQGYEFEIKNEFVPWIVNNAKTSMYNDKRTYIYNKAFYEAFFNPDHNPEVQTNLTNYFPLIRDWAEAKGIYDHGDSKTQYLKLIEEAGELAQALLNNDKDEIQDAIGDMVVVLTSIAKFEDLNIEKCIESAYNVISKRTGKMVNGTFVKDE
jgi:NTP pyrophosphatase (non-canonical NTP hydrolase)